MKTYGQYCPIARTSEMFAERWTPIIVRNLLAGCRTFTEIRAGAPGMPKALLAERLLMLEQHGVVERRPQTAHRGYWYELTERGRELKHICDAMGEWGARWLEMKPHHVDPAYVLWATCRLVDADKIPRAGVVARFDLLNTPQRHFWMILQRTRSEVCTAHPGRDEDLVITTDAETLVQWNLRRLTLREAQRAGRFAIDGPPALARAFASWVRPSAFAQVEPALSEALAP